MPPKPTKPDELLTVDYSAFVYGQDGNRLELKLSPKVPKALNAAGREEALKPFLGNLYLDLKHSGDWNCEFNCGRPAAETWVQNNSWLSHAQPKYVTYAHLICSLDNSSCTAMLLYAENQMQQALPTPVVNSGTKLSTVLNERVHSPLRGTMPLAKTCAHCEEDDIVKSANMMRCGGCKLTRYCSTECQREDWPRHKRVCKLINDAKPDRLDPYGSDDE